MILWAWGEQPETRDPALFPCDAFRWALQLDRWMVAVVRQYRFRGQTAWHGSHARLWGVSVTRHWGWGAQHIYYDGAHCSWSVGPVHFLWSGGWRTAWCDRCYEAR